MKPLRSCCCGCSLQLGTIIIAVLELVTLLVLLFFCIHWISLTNIKPEIISPQSKSGGDKDLRLAKANILSTMLKPVNRIFKSLVCVLSVMIIRVGLLIVGSYKNKLWMMIPWLGTKMTALIAYPIFFIYLLSEFNTSTIVCAVGSIMIVVFFLIEFYFYMVVLSHFEEIRKSQASPSNGQALYP